MYRKRLERITKAAYLIGAARARSLDHDGGYGRSWSELSEAAKEGWRAATAYTIRHASGLQGGCQ
jgi:hypothetical protein